MDAGKTFAEGPDGGWVQYQKITSTQSQLSQPEDPLAGGGLGFVELVSLVSLVPLMVQIGLKEGKFLGGGSLLTIRLMA